VTKKNQLLSPNLTPGQFVRPLITTSEDIYDRNSSAFLFRLASKAMAEQRVTIPGDIGTGMGDSTRRLGCWAHVDEQQLIDGESTNRAVHVPRMRNLPECHVMTFQRLANTKSSR
jgi:hypothetical protein